MGWAMREPQAKRWDLRAALADGLVNRNAALRMRWTLLLCATFMAGCQLLPQQATPPREPVATHRFELDPADGVVGEVQVVQAREGDTLSDIARRFNLGYDEIVRANPGVDPWLPRTGTDVVLPTRFVLPDAPRRGVVINLAAMRLFYFTPPGPDGRQSVITHPIGIGRVGRRTPEGTTKVIAKATDPAWYPTPSIRREHAANGDPLPAVVPAGPDNPLGRHVLRLGWPTYLIHGTNRPYGIGLRASHGCVRMYPEDIEQLYDEIAVGVPVAIVNQPEVFGWQGDVLWLQTFPVMEDDRRNHDRLRPARLAAAQALRPSIAGATWDAAIEQQLAQRRGIAMPVSLAPDQIAAAAEAEPLERYLARQPRVVNQLPLAANWDGED